MEIKKLYYMVNVKELRIGNSLNYFDSFFILEGITKDNTYYLMGRQPYKNNCLTYNVIESFEPLPITPEILESCGFKKWHSIRYQGSDKSFGVYDFSGTPFHIIEGEKQYKIEFHYSCGECNNEEDICSIEYLHQLQNLYFALTQTELNCEYINKIVRKPMSATD